MVLHRISLSESHTQRTVIVYEEVERFKEAGNYSDYRTFLLNNVENMRIYGLYIYKKRLGKVGCIEKRAINTIK